MDIMIGDMVQVENKWYGFVLDRITTQDRQVVAYRVQPLANEALALWVYPEDMVEYSALKKAFGPIDIVESFIKNSEQI